MEEEKCSQKIETEKVQETQKWINKVKNIFGDVFDFSESKYRGSREKITIVCKKHGKFERFAGDVTRKVGCGMCVKEKFWINKVSKIHILKLK